MMSEDSYQVLKESYDNACLNAKDFRNKYEHGIASEYDVLRAEVQVRTLEPGLLQAENGVKLSKVNLKVLLGLDMNIEVTPANKLSDYENDKMIFCDSLLSQFLLKFNQLRISLFPMELTKSP